MPDDVQPVDVKALTGEQLEALTEDQVAYVQDLALRRSNPRLHGRIKDALKDKEKDIFSALCGDPFFYISPEIEIVPGFKVQYRTLYSMQQDDALEASAEFLRAATVKGGVSNMVSTVHMSKCFLAHAIETTNSKPFGQSVLSREFFAMAMAQPAEAAKTLVDLRTKRMQAIALIPQHILQILIEGNQVFQASVDAITRIGGATPAALEASAMRVVDAVGKSTGPQVAGLKPT
jgi:hypothetical protein